MLLTILLASSASVLAMRVKRLFVGGSAANEQLTAVVAALLILLLAVEGATILRIGSLLNVHAFVGMLLIPVVAMKLASAGWRALRYYRRADEYVLRGPPHVVLRVVVAPVVVLSVSTTSRRSCERFVTAFPVSG
jgi:hypothetical protein